MIDAEVLLLAAGKGTRLGAESQGRPKPLVPLAGEAVLHRNLRWLAAAGVSRAWINLHHQAEAILAAVGDGEAWNLKLHFLLEPSLLGTAGTARCLAPLCRRPLLVVYADNLLRFDLAALMASHHRHGGITVAAFDPDHNPHTGIAGSCIAVQADGRILEFVETRSGAPVPGRLVNAGVYVVDPERLATLPRSVPCDFGRDVFPQWLAEGQPLFAYRLNGYCLGLDTPAAYRQAEKLIHNHSLPLS